MLTDPKVETKLLRIMSEFSCMVLRNARFKEVYAGGRDIVVLELEFSYKHGTDATKTAVIAVDKGLTINEHTEIVESLLDG